MDKSFLLKSLIESIKINRLLNVKFNKLHGNWWVL